MQRRRGVGSAGERADDLFLLGKAPLLVLGEDQLPIDDHVELAWLTDLERGVEPGFLLDRGRETRGARSVVSSVAVFDDDALVHGRIIANCGVRVKHAPPGPDSRSPLLVPASLRLGPTVMSDGVATAVGIGVSGALY